MPVSVSMGTIQLLVEPLILIPVYALRMRIVMNCVDLIMDVAMLLIELIILIVVYVAISWIGLGLRRDGETECRYTTENCQN